MSSNQNKQITYIPLDRIEPHADNPNMHDKVKVQILALNIQEFGLLHPIGVVSKALDTESYTIVIGEGRYKAFQLLNQLWPDEGWDSIPAIVLEESDDYSVWGRRLSENTQRSFHWVGECIELANMKAKDKSASELAKLFGYSETHLKHMVAIGEVPGIEKVGALAAPTLVTLKDVEKFILPLRIQTDRQGNIPIWDYSEVTTCIEELANGKLSREDLPAYSAERREAIGKAKAEKRTEEPDNPELNKIKRELDDLREAAETRKTRDGNKIQASEQEIESLKGYIEKLEGNYESLKAKIPGPGGEAEEAKKLQEELKRKEQQLENVKKEWDAREASLMQQQNQAAPSNVAPLGFSDLSPDVVRQMKDDIKQQVEKELLEKAKKQAKEYADTTLKNKEYELQARAEELAEKEKQLKQKQVEDMDTDAQDFDGWTHNLEKARQEYLHQIGVGTINKYWTKITYDDKTRLCTQLEEVLEKMGAFFAQYDAFSKQQEEETIPVR